MAPVQSATWEKDSKSSNRASFRLKSNLQQTNLPQTVSFAEGLIRHILKLLWDGTWAPPRRVVLDHRGIELGHGLSRHEERYLTDHVEAHVPTVFKVLRLHWCCSCEGSQSNNSTYFLQQCSQTTLISLRSGLNIIDPSSQASIVSNPEAWITDERVTEWLHIRTSVMKNTSHSLVNNIKASRKYSMSFRNIHLKT